MIKSVAERGSIIFICGLFLSSIAYSEAVLDNALVPRYAFLALYLASFSLFSMFAIKKKLLNPGIIELSYLLFVLFTLLSVFWAVNFSESVFSATRTLLGVMVFYFTISTLEKKDGFDNRLFKWLSLLALSCFVMVWCVSVFQFAEAFSTTRKYVLVVSEITGLNSNKNLLSSYTFLLLAFVLTGIIITSGKLKKLLTAASMAMVCFLIFMGTRAVLLALLVAAATYLIWAGNIIVVVRKHRKAIIIMLLFLFAILLSVVAIQYNSIGGQDVLSATSWDIRLQLWHKTLYMFKDHFIFGVGAGNWKINFPLYWQGGIEHINVEKTIFQSPHNDFLQLLAENGLVGLALYLVFFIGLFRLAVKGVLSMEAKERSIYSVLTSFMAGYMVISFLDFPGQRIEHLILVNLLMGILYVKIKPNSRPVPKINLSRRLSIKLVMAMAALFCFYIGILRYSGEVNTAAMNDHRLQLNFASVARYADKAHSTYYTIDPNAIPLEWYKGNALASLGKTDLSLKSFQKAAEEHPYQINVLGDLATAVSLTGDVERSKQLYARALEIYPGYEDGIKNLSVIYLNEGQLDKAAETMKALTVQKREEFILGLMKATPAPVYSDDVKSFIQLLLNGESRADGIRHNIARTYFQQENYVESLYWVNSMKVDAYAKIYLLEALHIKFIELENDLKKNEISTLLLVMQPSGNAAALYLAEVLLRHGKAIRAGEILNQFSSSLSKADLKRRNSLLQKVRFKRVEE